MKLGRMLAESEPFPTIKPVGLRSNRKRTGNDTPLKKRNSELKDDDFTSRNNDSKLSTDVKTNRTNVRESVNVDTLDYMIKDIPPLEDGMSYHPLILEYYHVINGLLPLYTDLETYGGPKLLEFFYNFLGLYD